MNNTWEMDIGRYFNSKWQRIKTASVSVTQTYFYIFFNPNISVIVKKALVLTFGVLKKRECVS